MSPQRNPLPNTPTDRPRRLSRWVGLSCAICLLLLTLPTLARDLDAVSDGEHLWLVEPAPAAQAADGQDGDKPRIQVYHSAAEDPAGQVLAIDKPIVGQLMPRGLTAGDGLLLMVLDDRQIITLSPRWSPLMDRWTYSQQSLHALPEGCTLLGITIGDTGPWALVRVESAELLASLDQTNQDDQAQLERDAVLLNRALGLPEDYELSPTPETDNENENAPATENDADAEGDADTEASPQDAAGAVLPVYRLIHIQRGRWVSSPLPDDFVEPRFVVLLNRESDERPILIVEPVSPAVSSGELVLYRPITLIDAPAAPQGEAAAALPWDQTRIDPRPYPGRLWSAVLVEGQVVFIVERSRASDKVAVELYHLRSNRANESGLIGTIELPTASDAHWAAIPWHDALGLVARPAPGSRNLLSQDAAPSPAGKPFAVIGAMTLRGQAVTLQPPDNTTLTLYLTTKSAVSGHADLYIQIGTFVIAMAMMMLYYKRALRTEQIDLPDGIVLASFDKRMLAGAIDLAPGFWLAGTLYGISISDTLLFWPGNGVAKVLSAMQPGFIVIAVTLTHTTVCEVIFARSLGKFVTGLAIADEHGKHAKPLNVALRSMSKLFELFAPLMIILAIISPARQRLGDILARTTVVMRQAEKPKPKPKPKQDDDDY